MTASGRKTKGGKIEGGELADLGEKRGKGGARTPTPPQRTIWHVVHAGARTGKQAAHS